MKRFRRVTSIATFLLALIALTSTVEVRATAANLSRTQDQRVRTLTFADRVAYEYAIEEVYWRHRIWPKENNRPKPSLDEVMSPTQIEKKVEDYLRDSQLLQNEWQRPITRDQLQAEMDRIAQNTRQPDVLLELFAALGNEPFVIAECIARPILTQRLIADCSRRHLTQPQANAGRGWSPQQSKVAVYRLPNISAATDCIDDTWTTTTPIPAYRTAHTSLWTGSEMIVWGGYSNDGTFAPLNTGEKYDPTTDTWKPVTLTNAPQARSYHTAVWTGNEMIVWGGSDLNNGGRYNPSSDSWLSMTDVNTPDRRGYHTAIWTGSEMIIWGGFHDDFPNPPLYLNTGGRYSPSTDSWTITSNTNAPTARFYHTAVWTGTEMIIWGGSGNGGRVNTGARYNPVADSWNSTTITNVPARRDNHTAIWTGNEMIVWGGANSTYLNTGARYNPGNDSWSSVTTANAPSVRYGHTSVWTGSEMIIWGGFGSGELDSGGKYNPHTNSWTTISATDAPAGRLTHTAVWTGSEMIVFGGVRYGNQLNTGGRYRPGTDSWTSIATTNAPDPRAENTAVWTGSELIVWGGVLNSTLNTNTGGRYDPTIDAWIPTTVINAPSERRTHTAVWNGTEMIIWGGNNDPSPGNTGGRYNPATDAWTATSTVDAPSARLFQTAIWTGTEMIIWGGYSNGDLNTGGKYNPSTDTWAPTTTANAPTGRGDHTAIWTGNEMIIWGGGDVLNTGGRYNPRSDSWTETSTTNTGLGRSGHTAIWTGSEMIVWGGYSGGQHVNTGARYNPAADAWNATSTVDAPQGRIAHAAVWTGREMIVWGGYNFENNVFLNTGGRYNPTTDGWAATSVDNVPGPSEFPTAIWTGNEMIVWGGYNGNVVLNKGGRYCARPSTPIVHSAVSRKTHGSAGSFDVDLPLSGTPAIECRSGGLNNDYTLVVTFLANVSVSGSPQAAVTSGTGIVGSGGVSNGGMVTISGNVVTIPLTSVANAQTINVTLSGVNGSTNVVIPMRILVGDGNSNAAVNASDVTLTKSRIGQVVSATNFKSDVNTNGSINASDVSIVKDKVGTGLP